MRRLRDILHKLGKKHPCEVQAAPLRRFLKTPYVASASADSSPLLSIFAVIGNPLSEKFAPEVCSWDGYLKEPIDKLIHVLDMISHHIASQLGIGM